MTRYRSLRGATVTRRRFLGSSGAVIGGIGAAALIGCSSDDDEESSPTSEATAAGTSADAGSDSGSNPDNYGIPDVDTWEQDGAPFPYYYPEPAGEPKSGGTLVQAVTFDIPPFDPAKLSSSSIYTVTGAVYNKLIRYVGGPNRSAYRLEVESDLADTWEQSADGLQWTFKLREGVKWQNVDPLNGRDFVAEDVKIAYDRNRDFPLTAAFQRSVASIETPDDHTVVFNLSDPDPDFEINIGQDANAIYPSELIDRLDTEAVGTGWAILQEANPGEGLKMVANPDYFEGKPYLDGSEIRIIKEPAAQLAAFRAGQVFNALGYGGIPDAIKFKEDNPDIHAIAAPTLHPIFMNGYNPASAAFVDPRMRQAVALAHDRDRVIAIVGQGWGQFQMGIPWPYVFDQSPTAEQKGQYMTANPDEAAKLISAAGQEGATIKYLATTAYGANLENEELLLGEMLGEVGLKVETEFSDFLQHQANVGDPTARPPHDMFMSHIINAPSPNTWAYEMVNVNGAGAHRWYLDDPELNELSEKQRTEIDPQARREIWKQMYEREAQEMFRDPLMAPWRVDLSDGRVRYYRPIHPFYQLLGGLEHQGAKTWIDA